MDPGLLSLLAAAIFFVGSHFAMSHPFRPALVRRYGERGFLGIYSLVSLVTFIWMVLAFRATPEHGAPLWAGYDEVSWAIASVLTLVALVLFLGSFRGNPALPNPAGTMALPRPPHGVFRVTRHPMMWGFALWAIAHILIAPTARTLVLAGAILILALLGAHLQDRKKEVLLGEGWVQWESQTTYLPRWRHIFAAGPVLWLMSLALWLAITWSHIPLAYVPAGIWRWLG